MLNIYVAGFVAGLISALPWAVVNLLVDAAFLPAITRHTDQLNEKLLARPALNLLILAADVAFWGSLFGLGYALVQSVLPGGPVGKGLLWGLFMFLPFSRSMVESSLWTKVPRDMNVFWFVEGLAGLLAWGAALGPLFARLV